MKRLLDIHYRLLPLQSHTLEIESLFLREGIGISETTRAELRHRTDILLACVSRPHLQSFFTQCSQYRVTHSVPAVGQDDVAIRLHTLPPFFPSEAQYAHPVY